MNRSTSRRSATLIALAFIGAGCTDQPKPLEPTLAASGRLLASAASETANHLVIAKDASAPKLSAAITQLGGNIERKYDAIGVMSVSGLTDAAAQQLEKRSDVLEVELDVPVQWLAPEIESFTSLEAPSDAPISETDQSGAAFFNAWQWNMRQIDADRAWLTTDQGEGALVCTLDTGIDAGHLDLIGKVDLAKSKSFVPTEPNPVQDFRGHGTQVAALIASRGIGMASVAPDARLCAVKVLNRTGSGAFDWVIAGIIHATDVRADVINMSLGAYIYSKSPGNVALIEALQRALDYASNKGTLVIASAGNGDPITQLGINLDNDTPDFIHVPSQLQKVISVGATGPFRLMNFDQLAFYSNHGTTGVDMTAPGGNARGGGFLGDGIVSACSRFARASCASGGIYLAGLNGTSLAAPHVSGAAAVFATNTRAKGGDNTDLVKRYDARFLEGCLEKGLEKVNVPNMDVLHGKGRLNVELSMLCGSSPK
jgi:subtilisin family serine protease